MRKSYNYRNPTAAELERREKIADAIGLLGFGLAIINVVLWCTVLK